MRRFNRDYRLRNKTEIDFVFSSAKKLETRNFLLLYHDNNLNNPRIGIIIAKKNVPKAHDRNRFKRVIRETFRNFDRLRCIDIIFLARKGLNNLDNLSLNSSLYKELSKLKIPEVIC